MQAEATWGAHSTTVTCVLQVPFWSPSSCLLAPSTDLPSGGPAPATLGPSAAQQWADSHLMRQGWAAHWTGGQPHLPARPQESAPPRQKGPRSTHSGTPRACSSGDQRRVLRGPTGVSYKQTVEAVDQPLIKSVGRLKNKVVKPSLSTMSS